MAFKIFLLSGGLLLLACVSHAGEPTTPVTDQMSSTQTCSGYTIGTAAAIDIVGAFGYRYVNILNTDASANLWCGDNNTVTTSGPLRGWKIYPTQAVIWALVPFQHWYCITDGAAATLASVCKGR
jgi:hypothetical protein